MWKRQPPIATLIPPLSSWFETELGDSMLQAERRVLEPLLQTCFGYHLLQLSVSQSLHLFGESRVRHKHRAGPVLEAGEGGDLCTLSDYQRLPYESDSMDVVILHHVLEFSANPHILLREIQRVMVPRGHLFIIGFNPWSLFALRSIIASMRNDSVWHNHWLYSRRVIDWMHLLGFDAVEVRYGFHRPPVNRPRWLRDNRFTRQHRKWTEVVPLGAFYVIDAIKQVVPVTPIRPKWQARTALGDLVVVKPTAGSAAGKVQAQRRTPR